jgi:hypothetical protein
MTSTNEKLLAQSEALKKITEHNRDFLSLSITLPLGNLALKSVHTNHWLFTELPKEFDLANWTILAKTLNSSSNRWSGYVKNRWYIEGCNIKVKGRTGTMELSLNAFPSSYSSYNESIKNMQKSYSDTANKNTSSSSSSSSSKNTSKAVTNKTSVINEKWVKKYNIPSVITNLIKKICKVGNTDEQNVKLWFKWMDANIGYIGYTDHKHDYQWQINNKGGNCVDNSRMFRAGCLALGVKCNFMKAWSCCSGGECANHQFNKVYLNGKGIIVDTGRSLASWGSHWGSCSGGMSETTSSW